MSLPLANKNTITGSIFLVLHLFWLIYLFTCSFDKATAADGKKSVTADQGNLLVNPGAEMLVAATKVKDELKLISTIKLTEKVPAGWGVFNTFDTSILWGTTDKNPYTGKSCCMLQFLKRLKGKNNKEIYTYILLGKSNGYSGEYAIAAEPNTEYAVSFWLRGDMEKVCLKVFTWDTPQADTKERKFVYPKMGEISVDNIWHKTILSFKTGATVHRFAIGLQIMKAKPGQSLYVDEAMVCRKPKISFKRKASRSPKVGLYKAPNYDSIGTASVYTALTKSGICRVELIDSLASETIKDFDVLVVTTTRKLSVKDAGNADLGIPPTDFAASLLNFVDSGGGLVLGHDCVGFRGVWSLQPFYRVCAGNAIKQKRTVNVSKPAHPVMAGVTKSFKHSYLDHVVLTPDAKADILAKDEDGAPVIVAGTLSRGRIVCIGYPMGLWQATPKHEESTGPVQEDEKKILLNAIKWCNDTDKYNVPQILTDLTLVKDIDKIKRRKEKDEAEKRKREMLKFAKLPPPKKFDDAVMWLFSYRLKSENQIIRIIDNCKRMGFTEIMVLAKSGGLFYKSTLYPDNTFHKADRFLDVVAIAERESRKRGLKFAVQVYPFREHSRAYGKKLPISITSAQRSMLDRGMTQEEIIALTANKNKWNCPDHPDCQQKVINICEELIKKFHPDEMIFDFVRYVKGYQYPCCCDFSLALKAKFAKAHPEIAPENINEAFAREQLVGFYTRLNQHCKKLDPHLETGAYTYATNWVLSYPFDYHTRYVSRYLTADWPMSRIRKDTIKYDALVKKYNPNGAFVPMLSSYDHKTGEYIYTELKLLSDTFDKLKTSRRKFIYYHYGYLVKNKKTGELYNDVAQAFSKALGGCWEKQD